MGTKTTVRKSKRFDGDRRGLFPEPQVRKLSLRSKSLGRRSLWLLGSDLKQ
jgi:hypothetical protein